MTKKKPTFNIFVVADVRKSAFASLHTLQLSSEYWCKVYFSLDLLRNNAISLTDSRLKEGKLLVASSSIFVILDETMDVVNKLIRESNLLFINE